MTSLNNCNIIIYKCKFFFTKGLVEHISATSTKERGLLRSLLLRNYLWEYTMKVSVFKTEHMQLGILLNAL